MFGLGIGEIAVILIIALVVIGPKKLPELAKTLGSGFKEFQNAMRGLNQTVQNSDEQKAPAQQNRVPWEEQFKDDPPHEQNLTDEDLSVSQAESVNQDDLTRSKPDKS